VDLEPPRGEGAADVGEVCGRQGFAGRVARCGHHHPFGPESPTNHNEGLTSGLSLHDTIWWPASANWSRTTCTAKLCSSQGVISIPSVGTSASAFWQGPNRGRHIERTARRTTSAITHDTRKLCTA